MAKLGNSGFSWDPSKIQNSLKSGEQKFRAYISNLTSFYAARGEAAMKSGAPWTDRTGNARGGLTGYADNSKSRANHWEITFYGKMSYNLWLEVKESFGGQYQIIIPTTAEQAGEYWQDAHKVMSVMFAGGHL